ncbi:NERD domain-containing protein [Flavobacterium sp. IMCC34852]|uniref:NERD domain-containing protein n=1 Tax=Flavobacterium rivulicola TaxID=2732161 RepID=A0A7Y3R8B4_9FLAO|nr:NERD domain-containing protein [Flavobacterium sp. IMCC34852]NNT71696.1 NERD domain-containing protein [Flavobacterium sp. IMCC34852]
MPLVLLILFITLIVLLKIYQADIKGAIGEQNISLRLRFLDKSKYKVINNVVLQSGDYTSQIDHIVISDYGVFVIETKNYKGWILGNEHSEYWTQVIYKRKEKLYNPIRQNLGHIKTLRKCLSEHSNVEYKSIIVFSSRAAIKVNTVTDVIYSSQLVSTIKRYSDTNLTEIEKENIFSKISGLNRIATYDKRQHIKSIKQRIEKRENSIREDKCPQCGGRLILREGKFGDFLGCSNYPKCTQTIKLE